MDNLIHYLLLLLAILSFIILNRRRRRFPNLPPSPGRGFPLIGHLRLMGDSLHHSLASLASRCGPIFSLRLGCRTFVVVSSPSAIEECFTKNDVVFANRPKTMAGDRLTYNYSTVVFSPYGHRWRVLRRLSVVEMFSSHRQQKSAGLREGEVRVLVRALAGVSAKRIDLNYLVSAYSFNIMMRTITGRPCVAEKDLLGEVGKENVKSIRGIFFSGLELGLCDFFPFLRWIGYKGLEKKLILLAKKRDEFLRGLINEFKGRNSEFLDNTDRTLVEMLLSVQASEPEFYTDDVIKSFLLTMIIAGTETSAVTMEWAMSLLLTHPEELQKLQHEIDTIVGHGRLINDNDLSRLPYLQCVVNETLRLYSPVPLLLPHFSSDQCTVGGYTIPCDTTLLVNAWAMHRDPNVWDEPLKFKPERFQGVEFGKEGWKFVPFGMGRRACPGAGLGNRIISLALGAFVQCFKWESLSEHVDMDVNYNSRVMLQKSKPLEAIMCSPRHQAADLLSQI